ncbi:hypothetical protein BD310DRAFT_772345, partial [Dichomitus squalens]
MTLVNRASRSPCAASCKWPRPANVAAPSGDNWMQGPEDLSVVVDHVMHAAGAISGPSPTPASTNGKNDGQAKIQDGSGSRDQHIMLTDREDSGKLKRKFSKGGQTFASLLERDAEKRRKTVEIVS